MAEIVDVDGAAMLVLPPAVLARLGVKLGETIDLVVDGEEVSIRRHVSEQERQAAIARDVMTRRRHALAELAK